jgi:hypothetical protein
MADYRLSVSVSKRSDGRSATAMAAYRASEAVLDHRTGKQHDYTRKSGVLYSEIIAPDNAPDWATDRTELWNNSEAANRRSDAIITREIQLSLPHEMNNGQCTKVAREFADHMAQRYGVAVDLNLHAPNKDGDERNYHAHLMLCTRRFDAAQDSGLKRVREA